MSLLFGRISNSWWTSIIRSTRRINSSIKRHRMISANNTIRPYKIAVWILIRRSRPLNKLMIMRKARWRWIRRIGELLKVQKLGGLRTSWPVPTCRATFFTKLVPWAMATPSSRREVWRKWSQRSIWITRRVIKRRCRVTPFTKKMTAVIMDLQWAKLSRLCKRMKRISQWI